MLIENRKNQNNIIISKFYLTQIIKTMIIQLRTIKE